MIRAARHIAAAFCVAPFRACSPVLGQAGAVLLTALLACAAVAEEHPGYSLTLEQLIATAQHDNKDLRAARYAVAIARARLLQAGALPNPRITVGMNNDVAFNNEGAYSASVGISQDFPVAGRIFRQKKVAQADVELAQAEIMEGERRLAGQVAANVYRVLVLDQQLQSRESLQAVDEHLVAVTRSRFQAAEVSELDVNTVALDLQRLNQEGVLLLTQRKVLLQSLNQELGRPAAATLTVAEPVPGLGTLVPVDSAVARALAQRPDLRMAKLRVDRAEADLALAKAQRWEDWSLGLGVQQDRLAIVGAPPQGADRSLNLSVTIPLPLKRSSRGQVAAAEASAAQAAAQADAVALDIGSEIAAAHAELEGLQSLLKTYDTDLLPVSERNVSLAEKGYEQGLVPLLEVVQAQRQHGELKAAALTTLDQYLQALARLRTATVDYPLLADSPP